MVYQRWLAITVTALLVASCGRRSPGNKKNPLDEDLYANRSVETFASPLEVVAGQEVQARCVVRDQEEHLPGVPVTVSVSASANASEPTVQGDTVTFRPRAVGQHVVACETADGHTTDPVGVRITVRPNTGVVAHTRLELPQAQAGRPVSVFCDVYDAYGNLVPDAKATGVTADDPLEVRRTPGGNYNVRGTQIGDFEVACELDGYVDPTPAVLTVLPGIPTYTETIVSPASVRPTELVNVTCEVTDQYGNVLEGYPSSFYLWPTHGGTLPQSGVTQSDSSFSATKAGLYYVFCNVPGFAAGDESPAEVRVRPGMARSMAVDLLDQDCYWQNRRIPLHYEVYDEWGNLIDPADPAGDFDLQLISTPDGAVVPDGNGAWIVVAEGDIDLALTPSGTDVHPDLQPEYFSIRVDSTPPIVNITSPGRAEMVQGGGTGSATRTISGSAFDSVSPIVSLMVNTTALSVSGTSQSVTISSSQTSRWGLNIVNVVAEDECGNRGVTVQSYIRSGEYGTAATAPNDGAQAPRGILAHLNQDVIDDGNRATVDDLATLAERILGDQDFNALLANPLVLDQEGHNNAHLNCNLGSCARTNSDGSVTSCAVGSYNCTGSVTHDYMVRRSCSCIGSRTVYRQGYAVRKTGDFTYWRPRVEFIDAVQGGLHLNVYMGNLRMPLRVRGAWDPGCCLAMSSGVSGTITADWVDLEARVQVSMSGGQPQVSICSGCLNPTFTNLRVNIDWGIFNFMSGLLDSLVNAVFGLFEEALVDMLADLIKDDIAELIEEFLGNFELEEGFDLPAPFDMALNISSGLDTLRFCGPQISGVSAPAGSCPTTASLVNPGWGQLGLFTQIYPSAKASYIPWDMGYPRRNVVPPSFSNTAYRFGIGLSDDALNQILWALWFGGGLDLNLGDIVALMDGEMDLSGIDLSLRAYLPPVVMPGGLLSQILVGLGDVYVDASVDLAQLLGQEVQTPLVINVGMYLSALMRGGLDLDPATNELSININGDPEIHVEVVEIDDPGYQAAMSSLFAQLLRYIVPRLMDAALGSFPIPEFNLTQLSGLELGGEEAVWSLHNGNISRKMTCYPAPLNFCINEDAYRLTGDLH